MQFMIKILQIIILVIISLLMMSASCDKGNEGCIDANACNYNKNAAIDDNSCWFKSTGCDCEDPPGSVIDCLGICDADILNDPDEDADGNCCSQIDEFCDKIVVGGCIEEGNCNYDPNATHNDGSCASDLSDFGGLSDGTDCIGVCGGSAVKDKCDLCVGGETGNGKSWRLTIISEVTFKLSNGLQVGTAIDSVTLGTSIFAKEGYNSTEINEGDSSCNDCYIDIFEPPEPSFFNNNLIRFYFPHYDNNEWEEWGSQIELPNDPLFDNDIRANDYYSLFTDHIGLNWYAEIQPITLDTLIMDEAGNFNTYSPIIDSIKLNFIYKEEILSEESEKFSIIVYLDREKGVTEGGTEYIVEGDNLIFSIDSDQIIKLTFNISNICFSEFY